MPSTALGKFEGHLLEDVHKLIDSHARLNHNGGGRRGLGHITRSGVVMLCAAWELYLEELLIESLTYIVSHTNSPDQLPKPVQKELSKSVKESKHELKPLELAGDGWKTVLLNHARNVINGLNTPKSHNIDDIFKRLVGVENLSTCWSLGGSSIDNFVSARGDIAHRGRDTAYITINTLKTYYDQIKRTTVETDNGDQIKRTTVETDNGMADFIQNNTTNGTPWRRRTI